MQRRHGEIRVADHVLEHHRQARLIEVQLVLGHALRSEYLHVVAPGHAIVVLDEEGAPRLGCVFTGCVHVGDACQARPEAPIGEQVVDLVDEILFQRVVGVRLAAATLHGELEAPQVGEGRVRRLLAVEDDLERRILAARQPEVPARMQLHVQRHGVARRGGVGEHAGMVRLVVAAVFADGAEVGFQGEIERLRRFEQAVPGARRGGVGWRLARRRTRGDAHAHEGGERSAALALHPVEAHRASLRVVRTARQPLPPGLRPGSVRLFRQASRGQERQ